MNPLLRIRDYRLDFDTFDGVYKVLDGIDLDVAPGETLGIVGETGCGKSVLARSVMGLNPSPPAQVLSGSIEFEGQDLLSLDAAGWSGVRGVKIAMIFQDPMTYLNPVLTIGRQLTDVVAAHESHKPAQERRPSGEIGRHAIALLDQVRLPDAARLMKRYPHQLSGGMRQRVLIAMALSGAPKLLIADEPTTALDVTVQAQVLALIQDLVQRLGLSVVMISHDFGAVAAICRRIAVMYAGTIVEEAPTRELLTNPRHPYTRGLLAALPTLDGPAHRPEGIPGSIPNLLDPPSGCRFHPRCPLGKKLGSPRCVDEKPLLRRVAADQRAACHFAGLTDAA